MSNIVEILFTKLKEDAKIPSKRDGNGGYDVYACFEEDYIEIPPHEIIIIPTGIASVFDKNYVIELKERGSTGVKGMAQRAGIIDSNYRGEWFIPICNTNNKSILIIKDISDSIRESLEKDYIIYPYSKAITQFLLLPVPSTNIKEIPYDEFITYTSDRGTGKLGSSGK